MYKVGDVLRNKDYRLKIIRIGSWINYGNYYKLERLGLVNGETIHYLAKIVNMDEVDLIRMGFSLDLNHFKLKKLRKVLQLRIT